MGMRTKSFLKRLLALISGSLKSVPEKQPQKPKTPPKRTQFCFFLFFLFSLIFLQNFTKGQNININILVIGLALPIQCLIPKFFSKFFSLFLIGIGSANPKITSNYFCILYYIKFIFQFLLFLLSKLLLIFSVFFFLIKFTNFFSLFFNIKIFSKIYYLKIIANFFYFFC